MKPTSPEHREEHLVDRARAGDVVAFEALYRRHLGRIYAICLRMTGSPPLAEELTQETFLRGWQKLDGLRDGSGVGPWLRRIAIRVVLSDRRAKASRPHLAPELDSEPAGVATVEAEAGIDLEQAIGTLPRGARSVFVLHDIEGHTHKEIGELMEISPITSKTQLHRARKLLRERLIR